MEPKLHSYPPARREESVVEELHGVKIADPYRWLEDPDSEETKAFVEAQNSLFYSIINDSPVAEKFKARLTKAFDYEKYGCPMKYGSKYFYFYNSGLQAQSVLYKQAGLREKAEVLLDPNVLDESGTTALNTFSFTESGDLFAYGISERGSDWVQIFVKRVKDNSNLEDHIKWAKFTGISWTHDDKGFFYGRYPEPNITGLAGTETLANMNHALYYHRLGEDQSLDVKIADSPENPLWMFGGQVSDDGKMLIITVSESTDPVNKLWMAPLDDNFFNERQVRVTKIVDDFSAQYDFITNDGDTFYFKTNLNAPKYKIVKFTYKEGSTDFVFEDVITEQEDPLDFAVCTNENYLVLVYLRDCKHVMALHKLQNGSFIKNIPLEVGSIVGLSGHKKHTELFYKSSSFTNPGRIFRYELSNIDSDPEVFRETKLEDFDMDQFVVKQVFYPSKDGTKIPMFIVHSKELELNGNNPTFLYGYGGFNISLTPSFSVARLIFIQNMGGILAIPNIRGGGEYGEKWHKDGCLLKKQNGFDDFAAAAKWLIQEKYTSPSKLCINGGSNGGLLVGASITQHPELFGCAVADVGVLDMLRFHKFTIGHAWMADYGNPDTKEDFEYLLKYSPLHNVTKNPESASYPAVLLTTADHDDRVVPLHSLKFIATLQHAFRDVPHKNPLAIRVDTKAGHGAGKPTKMVIQEATDKFAFIAMMIGAIWTD